MRKSDIRNYKYNQIITEKQGKTYIRKLEEIKEEQCIYCGKCGKDTCRLNIRDGKCINFVRKA